MGRQVEIAHTVTDEVFIIEWLSKRAEWLVLPRTFKDPYTEPTSLRELMSGDVVMFLKSSLAEVMGNVQALSNDPDTFHVFPRAGLCFDWSRSKTVAGSGRTYGRFYYMTDDAGWKEIECVMTKHFSALASFIKRTHPLISDDRHPIYVGPDLAAQIIDGDAFLSYELGAPISVSENPRYR